MKVITNVEHAQAFGCYAYLQVGSVGVLLGKRDGHPKIRCELFTTQRFVRLVVYRKEWRTRPKVKAG